MRHRGGGVKRKYRLIDFSEKEIPAKMKVRAIEYDPNRTGFIALVEKEDGKMTYVLAPQGLKPEMEMFYDKKAPLSAGNRMCLRHIPVGTFVYNVELLPGQGGKIARAAGNSCQIMAQEGRYAELKMPSGELRKILADCFASIGEIANQQHRFKKIGKAGRTRLMGVRPTVRGSAMNACDHPHGGGKNKVSIALKYPKTPWGKHASGVKTRKRKWTDKFIIERRKKKK